MNPAAQQRELLPIPIEDDGTVFINEHVSLQTEGDQRVVLVHGIVLSHYALQDRTAEAYAMVTLCEAGYADQNDIARSFGCSTRTLRRYQQRLQVGGLATLARPQGRPPAPSPLLQPISERDAAILRLKAQERSNRWIAGRMGLCEKAVRQILRRSGWQPAPAPQLPFSPEARPPEPTVGAAVADYTPVSPSDCGALRKVEPPGTDSPSPSFDTSPLDRSMDRLLATMGLLDDASPRFAPAQNLSRAGVLVAIPALVASGLLPLAEKIYRSLGPAFYGLRTTLVAYVLLALLRIPRPEALKAYPPAELGRIVGLDRMPEVKTLRRKLAQLAIRKGSYRLGHALAQQRLVERGQVFAFLYLDGHVRVYHGQRTLPKTYVTRTHLAAPATTDYWLNDQRGDPLFVVTADANAAMTQMLIPVLNEVRQLLGSDQRVTVVFDRGGWSPKLFLRLLGMNFDFLTYRKGRIRRRIAPHRFAHHEARLEGRRVQYLLHEQPVRFLKGKLRLRQITRLTEDGHQTPIVTSRWDLPAVVLAYRMFARWRQENFFKYMGAEYLLDALADYQVEADDPTRSVPNPARKAVVKELRMARGALAKLQKSYGKAVLALRR